MSFTINDPTPAGQQTIVTGRTASDAVVELSSLIIRVFGIGVPFIVVVAGAAYGFIELQKVYRETEQLRADAMTTALEETRESYLSIANLNEKQIKNVDDTINLQDELGRRLKALRDEETQIADELQNTQEQLKLAQRETQEQIDLKRRIQDELTAARHKLEKKENDLTKRSEDLVKRAGSIADLQRELGDLAEAVIEALPASSTVHQMAVDSKSKYVIDPIGVLTEYSRNLQDKSATRALQKLAGLSEKRLRAVIDEFNGLGFAFWLTVKDPEDDQVGFFAVARQTERSYEGIVVITVTENRVTQIEQVDEIVATKLLSEEDWSQHIAHFLIFTADDVDYEEIRTEDTKTWLLTSLVEISEPEVKTLYGQFSGVEYFAPAAFKQKMREFDEGRDALKHAYEPPALNFDMWRRAQRFASEVLPNMNLEQLPESLKAPFEEFLTSAVHQTSDLGAIRLSPTIRSDVVGKVAAAALRPEFRIVDVRPFALPQDARQKGPVGSELETRGFIVKARFRRGEDPSDLETVEFELLQREQEAHWLLNGFKRSRVAEF